MILTVTEDYEEQFLDLVGEHNVPVTLLGHVTQGKVVVDDDHFGFVKDLRGLYENTLGDIMSK